MADPLDTLTVDVEAALHGDEMGLANYMNELARPDPRQISAMQREMEQPAWQQQHPDLPHMTIVNFPADNSQTPMGNAESNRQVTVGVKTPEGNQLFATSDVQSTNTITHPGNSGLQPGTFGVNERAYVQVGPLLRTAPKVYADK